MSKVFLLCCCLSLLFGTIVAAITTTRIPSFTYRDLSSRRRQEELRTIITTTGIFSIIQNENDAFFRSRTTALNGLCQCHKDLDTTSTDNVVFQSPQGQGEDVTLRTTIGTATVGMSSPMELDPIVKDVCGTRIVSAMEDLRDTVAKASEAAMEALDDILVVEGTRQNTNIMPSSSSSIKSSAMKKQKQQPLLRDVYGKEYPTLISIAEASNHLEHFHIYEKQQQNTTIVSSSSSSPSTMDWHTDAGLFLAFVPAYDCNSNSNTDNDDESFWVQNGSVKQRVQFDSNSIVIMMGIGMQHWLSTSNSMQATRHAVQMQPGQIRAWYGMMHLVPDHSIIQTYPKLQTFSDMKQHMVLSSSSRKQQEFGNDNVVSIGCGVENSITDNELLPLSLDRRRRRRLQHAADPSACNNSTNFFCWMQCVEIPNANQLEQYVQEDYSLYCLDPAILASSGNSVTKATAPCKNGKIHNSNCQGSWQRTAPGVPKSVDFGSDNDDGDDGGPLQYCYGGTSMYMDGFHWVHDTTCIIYLFPNWVVSSRGKLIVASLGTILASMSLELVIFQRRVYHSRMSEGYKRLLTTTLLYGLQLTMGYLLMLVIMTYSGVLFLCTILGLMMGHAVWNAKDALWKPSKKNEKRRSVAPSIEDGQQQTTAAAAMLLTEISDTSSNYAKGVIEDDNDNDMDVPEGATPCCMNTFEDL